MIIFTFSFLYFMLCFLLQFQISIPGGFISLVFVSTIGSFLSPDKFLYSLITHGKLLSALTVFWGMCLLPISVTLLELHPVIYSTVLLCGLSNMELSL